MERERPRRQGVQASDSRRPEVAAGGPAAPERAVDVLPHRPTLVERLGGPVAPQRAPDERQAPASTPLGGADVQGTVIDVQQQPPIEQTGSAWRAPAVISLIVVTFVALAVGAWGWALLSALVVLIMMPWLLGLLSPRIALLGLTRGFRQPRHVPVQMLTIEEQTGRRVVRIEGHLHGSVSPGDRLQVWGHRRQGVVHFRRGYNLTSMHALTVERMPLMDHVYISIAALAGLASAYLLVSAAP